MLFRHMGEVAHVFPHVKRVDGRTAELQPGEEAELDVADDFRHPLLRPVTRKVVEPPKEPTHPTTPAEAPVSSKES